MQPYAPALAKTVRSGHDEIMRLARLRVADLGIALDEPELEQLIHGFETLLLEALEGRGTDTRDFFLETAIPGVIQAGLQTRDEVVGGVAAWAVLLSTSLVERLPEESREPATLWLSRFFGDYAEATARVAREAQ